MTRVLNKQILFHTMILKNPFFEDWFEYFTMEHNEKFVLIQGARIEVSTQTITS